MHSFEKTDSVNAEAVYSTIIEMLGSNQLEKMQSALADTTSLNTGKANGINNRLSVYFRERVGHDIHLLECQFHINEIMMNHVIKHVDGKPTAPNRMEADSVYNLIKQCNPTKSTSHNLSSTVWVTPRAMNCLKSSLSWFLDVQGKVTREQ